MIHIIIPQMGQTSSLSDLHQKLEEIKKKKIAYKNDISVLHNVFMESILEIDKLGKECDYNNVDWDRIHECRMILKKYNIVVNEYWCTDTSAYISDVHQCEEKKRLHTSKLIDLLEKKIEKLNNMENDINEQIKNKENNKEKNKENNKENNKEKKNINIKYLVNHNDYYDYLEDNNNVTHML